MRLKRIIIFLSLILLGRMAVVQGLLADELITVEAALKDIFPQATQIVPETLKLTQTQIQEIATKARMEEGSLSKGEFRVHIAQKGREVIGYAFEDTVPGKWGPIDYLLGVYPHGKVIKVVVLSYQEKRGRPTAKPRFLKQFIHKTAEDPLRLRKDINGISGATVSSQAVTDGVRKLLNIFEEVYKIPALQ